MNLETHLIASAVPTIYYVPNYITTEDEQRLICHVNSAPKPKWTQLAHRRLQNWGGIPHAKGMIAETMPQWLSAHTKVLGQLGIFGKDKSPNHVLVNEYQPGQGIMPHLDGPLFYPTVTTISLGSHTMLDFHKSKDSSDSMECRSNKPDFSVLLERRSLVVLQDLLYTDYLHSIAEVDYDTIDRQQIVNINHCGNDYKDGDRLERELRISLTIRHVAHTTKFAIKLSK